MIKPKPTLGLETIEDYRLDLEFLNTDDNLFV